MTAGPRAAALLIVLFVALAGSAMLRTSVTFDEPVFASAGARGIATGDFSLVDDHPPLPQYLFGLPAWLAADHIPAERPGVWTSPNRYGYARAFLWQSGNRPEAIVMATRLVGLACGAMLVLATYLLARRRIGEGAALAAAMLAAFVPDVLAHSGIAYSDVPVALAMLLAVFALDRAVRVPSARNAALAGFACALALMVKFSAVILAPVAFGLLVLEWLSGRARDRAWWGGLAIAVPIFLAVGYACVVIAYRGDWALGQLMATVQAMSRTATAGRPAFLLGEANVGGWWYFYPVALVLKTPIALQALAVLAVGVFAVGARGRSVRAWAAHPLRACVVVLLLYGAALLTAKMTIGTRHALPMVPFACMLVAAGVASVWSRAHKAVRVAVAVLFAAHAGSALASYPFFLSYLGEAATARGPARTLVDSTTDWGQGLVALRGYMASHSIDHVGLGYFGSAPAEAYGIRFVPMPSFFAVAPAADAAPPRYLVVSATLLAGLYVPGDPYAPLREREPDAIVGGSLYVFDRDAWTRPR